MQVLPNMAPQPRSNLFDQGFFRRLLHSTYRTELLQQGPGPPWTDARDIEQFRGQGLFFPAPPLARQGKAMRLVSSLAEDQMGRVVAIGFDRLIPPWQSIYADGCTIRYDLACTPIAPYRPVFKGVGLRLRFWEIRI